MPLFVLDQVRHKKIALDIYDVADRGIGGSGHRLNLLTQSLETPKVVMPRADGSIDGATGFRHDYRI